MEREIKIEYNPTRIYAITSGDGHIVGLMDSAGYAAEILGGSFIYVAPEGIDTNAGTSANPVRTLAKAIELADDEGRDILLKAGIHTYFASHNTFGKRIVAAPGAYLVCIGTAQNDYTQQRFVFDSQAFFVAKVNPSVADHDHASGLNSGTGFWFTGRADAGATADKCNRFYAPMLSGGGILRLARLRLYRDIDGSNEIETPSATEYEWEAELIPDLETFFAGLGYGSAAFPSSDANAVLMYNHYNSLLAHGDGLGRVFVVTKVQCDLAGGTDYRHLDVVWFDGVPQYFYETPLSPSEADGGVQCYGNADTPGPMLRQWFMFGGGGYTRHTAIQPNKRIGDTDYEFSVTGPAIDSADQQDYARPCAVYHNGIPMFSTYDGSGDCYSAQQMSDEFETAGSYGSLPSYVTDILEAQLGALAKGLGMNRPYFSVYNRFGSRPGFGNDPCFGELINNVNPDSPFMTARSMTQTSLVSGAADPEFFESAEAFADNLFYGGALVNLKHFCEMPVYTGLDALFTNLGFLPVHGLGVNCRLKNCYVQPAEMHRQTEAITAGQDVATLSQYRTKADRIFVESWTPDSRHTEAQDGSSSSFSQYILGASLNGYAFSRRDVGLTRVRDSAFVGFYILADRVELWHVSAALCVYATTDGTPIHGCAFAYFSGYYLTPDATPIEIAYSIVREALSQCLIPPGSSQTAVTSADPLFKSIVNPYDLKLQAVSKGDFADSPGLAYTPETSFFTGPREAGAYDDRGVETITWEEFTIIFPWVMPTESRRVKLTNQRRDGVKSKLSVGKNSIRIPLQWKYALSQGDLRNLENLLNADESLCRIYFNPVSKPTKYLVGYVDQEFKHGGPMGLLPDTSSDVILEFDCAQPGDSIYEYL